MTIPRDTYGEPYATVTVTRSLPPTLHVGEVRNEAACVAIGVVQRAPHLWHLGSESEASLSNPSAKCRPRVRVQAEILCGIVLFHDLWFLNGTFCLFQLNLQISSWRPRHVSICKTKLFQINPVSKLCASPEFRPTPMHMLDICECIRRFNPCIWPLLGYVVQTKVIFQL